jgi:hypothetical protein
VGVRYDYFIAATGNDANDGRTAATAWASLSPLVTAMNALPDNGRLRAHVGPGTYMNTSGSNCLLIGGSINTGVAVIVDCEPGVVFSGVSGVNSSFLDVAGSLPYTFDLNGLGSVKGASMPRITGFDTGTGNGLGMASTGGATMTVRNFRVDGCVDGVSLHSSNSIGVVEDCVFENNSKSAFAHVHTGGAFTARRCDFTAKSAAIVGIGAETTSGSISANSLYEDCTFVPASAGQAIAFGQATLRRCQIGTLTLRAAGSTIWGTAFGPAIVTDSYVHASWDIREPVEMTRCYGRMTRRMRGGSIRSTFTNCVFADGASGATADSSFLNDNAFTDSAPISDINCVYVNMAVGYGSGFAATQAGYYSADDSRLTYGLFYNNTSDIDADLVALGSPYVANNITGQNPLIGSCNTYLANDYKVAAGSPALGAGSGGADIGLGLAT